MQSEEDLTFLRREAFFAAKDFLRDAPLETIFAAADLILKYWTQAS